MLTSENWFQIIDLDICGKENYAVIKFIFEWMEYENFANRKCKCKSVTQKCINAIICSEYRNVSEYWNSHKECCIEEFKNTLSNGRTYVVDTNSSNERDRYKLDNNKHNKIEHFMKVAYQIRCNFFHGDKCPTHENISLLKWIAKWFHKIVISNIRGLI